MIVSTANTATNFISVCQKSFQRYMYFVWVRAYVSFETLVGNRYHYFTRIGLFPCFSLWSLVEIEKLQLVCRRQSREWWRERAVPILLVPIFPPRQLRQKCFHCHCHCQCHCQRQCRCHQLEIENCFLKLFSGDAKAFIYAAVPGYMIHWEYFSNIQIPWHWVTTREEEGSNVYYKGGVSSMPCPNSTHTLHTP